MPDEPKKEPMPAATSKTFRPKRLTTDDIREGCIYLYGGNEEETRICVINEELRQGLDIVEKYEKLVTFFGSARFKPDHPYYEKARTLGALLAKETNAAIITGGGPGIMEAGNRGAFEAGGTSLGFTIKLPTEQVTNPYLTAEAPFYFFFTRKVVLMYSSEAYVFFPGGYGTFDELFELLTLVQTNKVARMPIILYGSDFWQPFVDLIKKQMIDGFSTIDLNDTSLFTVSDNDQEIVNMIKDAPMRQKS